MSRPPDRRPDSLPDSRSNRFAGSPSGSSSGSAFNSAPDSVTKGVYLRGEAAVKATGAAASPCGHFISFEGIDGAGKSTHLSALAEAFRARHREVLVTREPGGTALAEQLRALFLQHEMDALTEALLVFAGRRDHLNTVIAPALARGAVVICDRFSDATFAYQGGGRGFDQAVLAQLEAWVQHDASAPGGLRQPELTLWFDLAPAVAAARRAAARPPDRLEREDSAFFERVRAAYAQRAALATSRFVRIDADQPAAAVWAQVQAAVLARLPL